MTHPAHAQKGINDLGILSELLHANLCAQQISHMISLQIGSSAPESVTDPCQLDLLRLMHGKDACHRNGEQTHSGEHLASQSYTFNRPDTQQVSESMSAVASHQLEACNIWIDLHIHLA